LNKWRPLRSGLPAVVNELTALGMPAGAKFDAIVEQVFGMQLTGRGKTPEEREKILRKLSGIKEAPKKKEKEKKTKAAEKSHAAMAMGSAAKQKHADAETEARRAGKSGAKGAHKAADKREPARQAAGRASGKRTHARK
jgi:hypothetical protein